MHHARKAKWWLALAVVLALAPTIEVLAEPVAADEASALHWQWEDDHVGLPWVRVVGGTMLVIGLICVGVYVVKKLDGGGLLRKGRYMELLEARMVGRKLHLYLVRVAGRIVLLAAAGDSVTRVAEFAEEELPQLVAEQGSGGTEGFRSLFKKLVGVRE